jgi:glycosyltransferase involved in cell wall biosynthesis
MRNIFGDDAIRIGESILRDLERHAVLVLVIPVLVGVPLESHLIHNRSISNPSDISNINIWVILWLYKIFRSPRAFDLLGPWVYTLLIMTDPEVSIIIPHYQTQSLAQLCLRSIRRYTTRTPYEVIVVDNGSSDGASLEYLRSVKWIKLIERTEGISDIPGEAHKEALDEGIDAARGKFLLSFHTDTIPIRDRWLAWLVGKIDADEKIGAVGTYKLEHKKLLKRIEHWFKDVMRRDEVPRLQRPCIRSHCAMYRRGVMEELGLKFINETTVTGQGVHWAIEDGGYKSQMLSVSEMLRYVVHLNHGTMVLLPQLGARKSTIRKGHGRIDKFLNRKEVREILQNDSLDG